MQWKIPKEAKCENSFLEKGEKWNSYNDENISVEDIAENMTMLGI